MVHLPAAQAQGSRGPFVAIAALSAIVFLGGRHGSRDSTHPLHAASGGVDGDGDIDNNTRPKPAAAGQAPKHQPLRLALVGDSITFGNGSMSLHLTRKAPVPARGSYPAAIRRALTACGARVTTRTSNEEAWPPPPPPLPPQPTSLPLQRGVELEMFALPGGTGTTSNNLRSITCSSKKTHRHPPSCSFWESAAFDALVEFKPDVAVLMFGTNDSKELDDAHLGATFGDDMAALIAKIGAMHTFLMLPPHVLSDKFGISDSRLQSTVRSALVGLARRLSEGEGGIQVDLIDLAPVVSRSDMLLGADPAGVRRHSLIWLACTRFDDWFCAGCAGAGARAGCRLSPACAQNWPVWC